MIWKYRTIDRKTITDTDLEKISDLYQNAFGKHPARSIVRKAEIADYFKKFMSRKNARILVLENTARNNELIGFISYFELESIRLLSIVQSAQISKEIRERSSGSIVYSNIIAIKSSYGIALSV